MQNGGCGGAMKNMAAGAAKAVLRKGAWTPEEDLRLRRCIEKYGEGKWRHVPLRAGLMRCRKSCRLRWLNYLRPNLKRGDYTEAEIDLILRLHKLLGNKWALIAGRIPGRTANDIKNYWNAHLCKTLAANSTVGTKATGENGNADGGSGKLAVERTRPKNYNMDTMTMSDALPAVARTHNKASTSITATVFRPRACTLTASIRLAMAPGSVTRRVGGGAAHCSLPAQTETGGGGDIDFPGSSIDPTPPTPDDQTTMWWHSLLEGLGRGSNSGGEPPAPGESLFGGEMLWGDEEEDKQRQPPSGIINQ